MVGGYAILDIGEVEIPYGSGYADIDGNYKNIYDAYISGKPIMVKVIVVEYEDENVKVKSKFIEYGIVIYTDRFADRIIIYIVNGLYAITIHSNGVCQIVKEN